MDRIIDANTNRTSEALRVVEEIARFYLDNKNISEKLKHLRHELLTGLDYESFLNSRDSLNDIGPQIQNPSDRANIYDIFKANFKRLQQGLRVLEEYSSTKRADFEKARYCSYALEKEMFAELKKRLSFLKLQTRSLYLVTDRTAFDNDSDFLDAVKLSLDGGVEIIQLREKTAPAKKIVDLAFKVNELCRLYDCLFIVNDRTDIAHYVEADGVHLGQDDVDIKVARKILKQGSIIGISTHKPEQALKAQKDGADYIGVGPVFATPTKQGREPVGLDYVSWAAKNIHIPFFAIGGIDLDNIKEVANAGAKRAAVVRAIINAADPDVVARSFLKNLEGLLTTNHACCYM